MKYIYELVVPLNGKSAKLRLVGGSWCIAALILTTMYSDILIAFIMAPDIKPLVNSVQELADSDEVNLVVWAKYATEGYILVN